MITEEMIVWFDRLGQVKQIDELLVMVINDASVWVQALTLNQRLIMLAVTCLLIFALKIFSRIMYQMFIKTRRWYRRRCIPKRVNLHLDRDS